MNIRRLVLCRPSVCQGFASYHQLSDCEQTLFPLHMVCPDVDFARGVALFFRKSLGGVAAGLFFGFAILAVLKLFNRRFTREENVTEVSATLALAYVGYFCADYVWATSGVIATLAAGLTVKFLGRAIVNDEKLLQDFWQLLEHLLNTVLFTLGKYRTGFDCVYCGMIPMLTLSSCLTKVESCGEVSCLKKTACFGRKNGAI